MLAMAMCVLAGCERRPDVAEVSAVAGETAVPAAGCDIDACLEKAMAHLKAQTREHQDAWGIAHASWDADQETGILTWTLEDGRKATAPFQIVGTYSVRSGTFLWSWDNPSILEPLSEDARTVRAFGKEHGIDFLQWGKIDCTEESAWELAALANLLCERRGVYRGPSGVARLFMTFGEVTVSGPVEGPDAPDAGPEPGVPVRNVPES